MFQEKVRRYGRCRRIIFRKTAISRKALSTCRIFHSRCHLSHTYSMLGSHPRRESVSTAEIAPLAFSISSYAIFSIFSRTDNALCASAEVCKAILQSHHCLIWITVTIELRIKRPSASSRRVSGSFDAEERRTASAISASPFFHRRSIFSNALNSAG